jgi:site-specific DNA-methyltransferase (adenine-specific)
MADKTRAPRNRTITLSDQDRVRLKPTLISTPPSTRSSIPLEGIATGDYRNWLRVLPLAQIDLLFLDPPYNLDKDFNGTKFSQRSVDEYTQWLEGIIKSLKPFLKPTATVYICGDWLTSTSIFEAASKHLVVRNRITWEREKGRGAKSNWKNASEDIWFCTMSDIYKFHVDRVKVRRKVMAPYTDSNGEPKDWMRSTDGNFRDTHPSNLWTDITIPFWSMPENTDHPTQKSEKLLAKLILASTDDGDFILDPFLGSGTTVAVAKKLQRRTLGIEMNEEYCLLAARRLEMAMKDTEIQGYTDSVFWERNTLQKPAANKAQSIDMFAEISCE